jgi:hypothetical protein
MKHEKGKRVGRLKNKRNYGFGIARKKRWVIAAFTFSPTREKVGMRGGFL